MKASVTIFVRPPDDVPAVGARVQATNHAVLVEAHRRREGTTDSRGMLSWPEVEIGPVGDRFTFVVDYADATGERWHSEARERVFDTTTITITLDLA